MKYLGYLGIILIQAAYIPQLWRTIKTKNTDGLSPWFLAMVWLGIALLQVYSYHLNDLVYIISNWFGLINTGGLIFLLYRGKKNVN